jgi:maleylacetoacetate isomerase
VLKLFSFWRSLASYRVRIALNLKGLTPDQDQDVNLVKGAQRDPAYCAVNPMMALPALSDGDGPALFESLAIIEYLDETRPEPPLLPRDARGRARVRGLAQIVACDCHPLIVPRVREYLEHELGIDEAARLAWCRHWHVRGLTALETHLGGPETGRFCHGDRVTVADICLASQVAGAQFFNVDLAPFAEVRRVVDACLDIDAFASAHPLKQKGAPAVPPQQ